LLLRLAQVLLLLRLVLRRTLRLRCWLGVFLLLEQSTALLLLLPLLLCVCSLVIRLE
jgi:hypothetical protein